MLGREGEPHAAFLAQLSQGSSGVGVPSHYYKIIIRETTPGQVEAIIIMNLLDAAWRKRLLGLFGDTPPRTFSEKVEAVRASIDQRAYNDLVSISRLMSKKPLGREDLIEAHRKCQLLIDYFRGLLTRS